MSDALWAARLGDALDHTSMMVDILGGVLEVAANIAKGGNFYIGVLIRVHQSPYGVGLGESYKNYRAMVKRALQEKT